MGAAMQLKPLALSIPLLLSACTTQAPIVEGALPPLVRDARQTFIDDCRPDAPKFGRDLILRADLNGDAQDDYVVNGFAYQCRKDTPFCGSAGCEVQVFLSAPGGGLEQRFDGWLEGPALLMRAGAKTSLYSGVGKLRRRFDPEFGEFVPG